MPLNKGYIHVYTGDGKGKTTAALGLVLRALGSGMSVCVVQFIKSMAYHEIHLLERLGVPIHQFGRGCFIRGEPTDEDRAAAQCGLTFVRGLFDQNDLDLLILDEINVAQQLRLLTATDVLDVIHAKPNGLELVCTGRGAPQEIIDAADLVTEMTKIKHYYDSGVLARDGIDR